MQRPTLTWDPAYDRVIRRMVRRHHPLGLRALAFGPDDLEQIARERVARNIGRIDAGKNPLGYVRKLARSALMDVVRAAHRDKRAPPTEFDIPLRPGAAEDTLIELVDRAAVAAVDGV